MDTYRLEVVAIHPGKRNIASRISVSHQLSSGCIPAAVDMDAASALDWTGI